MLSDSIRLRVAKAYRLGTAFKSSSSRVIRSQRISSCSLVKQVQHRPISPSTLAFAMPKRKSSALAHEAPITSAPIPPPTFDHEPPSKRRASQRKPSAAKPKSSMSMNPNVNANVLDAPEALRASPDASEPDERMDLERAGMDVKKQVKNEEEDVPSLTNGTDSDSPLSEMSDIESPVKKKAVKGAKGEAPTSKKPDDVATKAATPKPMNVSKVEKEPSKESQFLDPEDEGLEEADEEEIQAALSRPPPVNSDYLPLPWKGRIGYVSPFNAWSKSC